MTNDKNAVTGKASPFFSKLQAFVGTIGFTLKYALVMVISYNILGLMLAILLNRNLNKPAR